MIMQPQLKDAAIVQQAYQIGPFSDMLRLTYQRHAAYAWAHNMEYWPIHASLKPDLWPGGWGKIYAIQLMMQQGYEHVFWIDTDAAITDMDCDLREGLPEGKLIGACEHWAEWFKEFDIPRHYNVGVLFMKNHPIVTDFLREWIGAFPGDKRWWEQGVFNDLVKSQKYEAIFHRLDDKWNATYQVNEVEQPCIMGWHGVMPEPRRFAMMRKTFEDDYIRFRV